MNPSDKIIALTLGRFNPPHIGHSLLFKKLIEIKKHYNCDEALVYTTHSFDPKKNPLPYNVKIDIIDRILKEKYPEVSAAPSPAKNVLDALVELEDRAEHIILVVGGDRLADFEKLLNKYNGNLYAYESISVISAGDRDPDAEGVSGMSASKMRQAVVDDNFELFKSGVDSFDNQLIDDLWFALKEGMKMNESYYIPAINEAITYDDHIRMLEADETVDILATFRSRYEALTKKAGVNVSDTAEAPEEESSEPVAELTEEGKALDAQFPEKDLKTYKGTVGVLLVDEIAGTGFFANYLGEHAKLLKDTYADTFGGFTCVIRQLKETSENEKREKLIGAKIAWSSEEYNKNYLKMQNELRVDFRVDTTEDVLKNISADQIIISSIGTLTPQLLADYVAKFNSESKRLGLPEKNIDAKAFNEQIKKYGLTRKGNMAMKKEREALANLDGFVASSGPIPGNEIKKFSETYQLDKRIIANYLSMKSAQKKIEAGDFQGSQTLEKTLGVLGDELGVGALIMIADEVLAKAIEKPAAERKEQQKLDKQRKGQKKARDKGDVEYTATQ